LGHIRRKKAPISQLKMLDFPRQRLDFTRCRFNIQTDMKNSSHLLVICLLMVALSARAQTYSNIYTFTPYSSYPPANPDGALPYSVPVLSSNVLYGTTWEGGTNGEGTIFAVHTDGTGFTNLHTFSPLSTYPIGSNIDGAQPYDGLLLSSNVLYGTAFAGGTNGWGTVFRINTDGAGFTVLRSLSEYTDGAQPRGGLIISNNTLFGTAAMGGSGNYGTVFRINIDGKAFTNLHNFTALAGDGAEPQGGVVLSGTNLYGMTLGGGSNNGNGVIFSLSTAGSNFTYLYTFSKFGAKSTNANGGSPYAALTLSNSTLYGVTDLGGTNGNGVVFSIGTDGLNFKLLHTFALGATDPNLSYYTNKDGIKPQCQLLLSGNILYGTTTAGGLQGIGTVFSLQNDGTGFSNVYTFTPIVTIVGTNIFTSGGANPECGVVLAGSALYGTTAFGGINGNVYELLLGSAPASLSAQASGGQLTLTWPGSSYSLQSTGDLSASFSNVGGASSPYVVPMTNARQFYRLNGN
jgi:uncharacterized repeat protein (TIGR03803 family)